MFVSGKRLEETKAGYEVRLEELRSYYEARITELHARIADLSRLVFSPTTSTPTPVAREADAIITPTDPPLSTQTDYSGDELRERDLIFSGAYEDLIN